MSNKTLRFMVEGGLIAAIYTTLTLVLAPIGFGPFQCRISEALTILPVFTPAAIPGLTLGCIISNTIGLVMGVNIAGVLDIPFGSAATLLAALLTYACRNIQFKGIPVVSALPPILLNAAVIGAELSVVLKVPFWEAAIVMVGVGEAVACIGIGLLLAFALKKTGAADKMFYKPIGT